jgi:hypothetical protein
MEANSRAHKVTSESTRPEIRARPLVVMRVRASRETPRAIPLAKATGGGHSHHGARADHEADGGFLLPWLSKRARLASAQADLAELKAVEKRASRSTRARSSAPGGVLTRRHAGRSVPRRRAAAALGRHRSRRDQSRNPRRARRGAADAN